MMTKIYRALEAYTKRRSRQGSTSSGGSDEQGSANGQVIYTILYFLY